MDEVTRRLAFYDLRDWWLSQPRVRELLDAQRFDSTPGATPFFPVAEQPESGFPYVRYTVARDIATSQWWMQDELVGIEIFMHNIEDANELLNILIGMTSQGSVSAQALQLWVSGQARPEDFEYHSLTYVGGGDIGAPSEEGATYSRVATFSVSYSPLQGWNIV